MPAWIPASDSEDVKPEGGSIVIESEKGGILSGGIVEVEGAVSTKDEGP